MVTKDVTSWLVSVNLGWYWAGFSIPTVLMTHFSFHEANRLAPGLHLRLWPQDLGRNPPGVLTAAAPQSLSTHYVPGTELNSSPKHPPGQGPPSSRWTDGETEVQRERRCQTPPLTLLPEPLSSSASLLHACFPHFPDTCLHLGNLFLDYCL